jgi:CheY-like chemotaxis protein
VLVVDDEADALELIRRVLQEQGATPATAASAHEALKALEESTPDVIVSDIGMPVMDGFEFMRKVREREPSYHRIPALALTAFARPEDRKRAVLSGFQSYLAKPFDMAELVIVVAALARRT